MKTYGRSKTRDMEMSALSSTPRSFEKTPMGKGGQKSRGTPVKVKFKKKG